MLKENDRGYAKGGKPSGYFKLEQSDIKAKILIHIQNLELPRKSQVLKAYLLSGTYQNMEPLYLGVINLKGSFGDLSCEFSKRDKTTNAADLSKYDTVAVMCKDTEDHSLVPVFPLIGYKNQEWQWREVLLNAINKTSKSDVQSQDEDTRIDTGNNTDKISEETTPHQNTEEAGEVQKNNQREEVAGKPEPDESADEYEKEAMEESESIQEIKADKTLETEKETEAMKQAENVEKEEGFVEEKVAKEEKTKRNSIGFALINSIFNILSGFKRLEQPFDKVKPNYQWWMIDDINFDINMVYEAMVSDSSLLRHYHLLNNFLIYNNPYALNAIYQYGYYILGAYYNPKYELESIVYAIPGRYGVEPHPLLGVQAYATWIPKNGSKIGLGSMGYWVVKVNIKNGELSVMK